jgi:hypothetical protein
LIANDLFPIDGTAGGRRQRFADTRSCTRRHLLGCLAAVLVSGGACSNTTTINVFNPDLGLLAHWAFDEGEPGSVAIDSSGFGHHGKPSANPPTPIANTPPVHFQDRYSLSFNGQDQWIEIGNPPLLNVGGPISVAAWLRPSDLQPRGNIVAHGFRFGPSYDFALRIDVGFYVFTTWDSVNHQATATAPPSDVGAWVHLCGVFDGATYALYRNGVQVATTADTTAPQPNVEAIWAIGGRAAQPTGGVENLIKADIDDVRIYGRALSAADVEALYAR